MFGKKFLLPVWFLLLAAFGTQAAAQADSRAIRMIVGFPPGQATELVARTLAAHLSTELGRPVIVENRPGQGGSIALGALAKSPADGSVITLSALASYVINPHLYKSVPYDVMKDIEPVALVAEIPVVLVINPSLKVNSFAELVKYVKANPGKVMHSSSGNGTVSHLGMQDLKQRAGLNMQHVPYQGSAGAMLDLVNNNVQVGFDSVAATRGFIDSKRLKVLASATLKRLPMFPDTPTIAELGFPGFEVAAWTGVSVPAGTPREVRERLNAAIVKIVKSPEFVAQIEALGTTPRTGSIEEFAAFLRAEYERWGKLVSASNAKVE